MAAIQEKNIDDIISNYVTDETPGLSLLIGKDDQVLLEKAYGSADLENHVKIRPNNNFIIASVTKQFTCMALMMLKEKGLLDYDETIDRFFPDLPDYRKVVTIRQLMCHTSGIKEYFQEGYRENEDALRTADTKKLLDIVKNFGGLTFEPDTQHSYCNSSYVMLGSIIEQISGRSFGTFLKENIFDPSGMTQTYAPDYCDNRNSNLVKGYKKAEDGGYLEQPYDMLAVGYADGNIFATARDLFKWHQILDTEKLVKKQTYAEALKSHTLKDGTETGYGFGLFIGDYKGRKEIWHTGGTMGYISRYSRYPDDSLAIIMLTNYEGIARDDIFFQIADETFRQLHI